MRSRKFLLANNIRQMPFSFANSQKNLPNANMANDGANTENVESTNSIIFKQTWLFVVTNLYFNLCIIPQFVYYTLVRGFPRPVYIRDQKFNKVLTNFKTSIKSFKGNQSIRILTNPYLRFG